MSDRTRETVGTGGGNGWFDPPILGTLPGDPRYDAQDLARRLGIPAGQLWEWEQTVHVPRPIRVPDGHGGLLPRYSERDLAAARWLLDQVAAGVAPHEAARRLLAAQQVTPRAMDVLQRGELSGPLARGTTTGISGIYPPATPSLRGTSGPLQGPNSGGLGRTMRPGAASGPLGQSGQFATVSGPLSGAGQPIPTSRPLRYDPSSSYPGVPRSGQVPAGLPSGPSGGGQGSAPHSPPWRSGGVSAPRTGRLGVDAGASSQAALHSASGLRMLQGVMLRAFAALDAGELTRLLDGALGEHAVEPVCMELLQPVIGRAGEMYHGGQLSDAEFHFGVVSVRNRLAALLDATALPPGGPLALLACAPGEHHELGSLMLAILWRQAGVRAIHLGVDLSEEALLQEARRRRPAVISLSAATEASARAIGRMAGTFARLDPPRPRLVYGGAAFVRQPDLQRRIKERDALFLGVDAAMATRHVVRLLSDGPIAP